MRPERRVGLIRAEQVPEAFGQNSLAYGMEYNFIPSLDMRVISVTRSLDSIGQLPQWPSRFLFGYLPRISSSETLSNRGLDCLFYSTQPCPHDSYTFSIVSLFDVSQRLCHWSHLTCDLSMHIGEGFDPCLQCVNGQKSVRRKLDRFQLLPEHDPSNMRRVRPQPSHPWAYSHGNVIWIQLVQSNSSKSQSCSYSGD